MDARKKSGLLEKLKGLYAKRKFYITGLESYAVPVLRQLIKDEEATWICRSCRGQLGVLKWNNEADIITCNNLACNKYRNPVGTILK